MSKDNNNTLSFPTINAFNSTGYSSKGFSQLDKKTTQQPFYKK